MSIDKPANIVAIALLLSLVSPYPAPAEPVRAAQSLPRKSVAVRDGVRPGNRATILRILDDLARAAAAIVSQREPGRGPSS